MKKAFSFLSFLAFALLSVTSSCKKDDGGTANDAGGTSSGFKVDDSFPAYSSVSKLALAPDNKIICMAAGNVFRLNTDGSRDNSFNAPALPAGSSISYQTMAVQSDGKVLLVKGQNVSPAPPETIIRLNSDGSLDNSFTTPALLTYTSAVPVKIEALLPLANGDVMVGGLFYYSTGATDYFNVVRIKPSGAVDNSFLSPLPFVSGNGVTTLALAADSKIIVSGRFGFLISGQTRYAFAKLNADGSAEPNFGLINRMWGTPPGSPIVIDFGADEITVQPDGKYLVRGGFNKIGPTKFEGFGCLGSARLNSDGTLDSSFRAEDGGPTVALASGEYIVGRKSDARFENKVFFGVMAGDGKLHEALSSLGFESGRVNAILKLSETEVLMAGDFYKNKTTYSIIKVKK